MKPLREVLSENRGIVDSARRAADELESAAHRAEKAVEAIERARIAAKWLCSELRVHSHESGMIPPQWYGPTGTVPKHRHS